VSREKALEALNLLEHTVSQLRGELITSVAVLPERSQQIKLATIALAASLSEDARFAKLRVELPCETYNRQRSVKKEKNA
jgi:hypothetical protein